ncbi:UbiA-like polyprenyltransferase [Candidatus Chlamydia sanziniae]|uniref:Polyprenyltransferase MenA n=1 Tax=Candidatus Chlamydia sanziniae TaxID=1806891 RepID=A0A1A9HY49_9CHLA|nr:UbiA-like polyprenyltransferase [Candidatus Chlamydia sanziniae]ANH79012.1 polyprenyltransferase MenA [Candidatus Chlamydia sanziniae]
MKLNSFFHLINFRYSIFSILFLSASTLFAFCLPEISQHLSMQQALRTIALGACASAFARTAGIVINQSVDCFIDERNPRTSLRVLPTKSISLRFAQALSLISSCIFLLLCKTLGVLSLGILATAVIIIYPYMKRKTLLCHWGLGLIYTLAILMNFSALAGGEHLSKSFYFLALLWGGSVGMIIAANDIIYAIQDIDFDKTEGLFSIPAYYGAKRAANIAALCLILGYFLYLSVGWVDSLGWGFYLSSIAPLIVILKVLTEYRKIGKTKRGNKKVFFLANIGIALSFLIGMMVFLITRLC